jgi:hypothetical protein
MRIFGQFSRFIFCNRWLVWYVVILENLRKHVSSGLAFGIAHYMDGGIYRFGQQLISQPISLVISPDDAAGLPEAYLIEEFVPANAYLANNELIQVVGG